MTWPPASPSREISTWWRLASDCISGIARDSTLTMNRLGDSPKKAASKRTGASGCIEGQRTPMPPSRQHSASATSIPPSAQSWADGGMLVALAECCLLGGIGVRCPSMQPEAPVRLDAAFFGESPSRFIVSVLSRAMPEMQSLARRHHVEISLLGLAGGQVIEFEGQFRVSLAEMRQAWEGTVN